MSKNEFEFYDPRKEAEKLNRDIRRESNALRKDIKKNANELRMYTSFDEPKKTQRKTSNKTYKTKSVPQKRRPSKKSNEYSYSNSSDNEYTGMIFGGLLLLAVIYMFIIKPIYDFITTNPEGFFAVCIVISIFILVIVYIYKKLTSTKPDITKEENYEEGKGLFSKLVGVTLDENIKTNTEVVDIKYKELDIISMFLQNEIKLRYGKNKIEKDYQQDLEQALMRLEERYDYEIKYESIHNNHRIDFLINNKIGVELKVYRGGSTVKRELFSQITEYAQYCDEIVGLVINITENDNDYIKSEIEKQLSYQNRITSQNYRIVVISVKPYY